jgi:DNA-binding transcriptional regulator YdaS (Cro superfamily)
MDALSKAIKRFGSQAKLAEALDVEPMAVTHWKNRGVPLKRAIQIEELTNGDISMRDLCPAKFSGLNEQAA